MFFERKPEVKHILLDRNAIQSILSGNKTMSRFEVPKWQRPEKTYDGEEYITIASNHREWGFGLFGNSPDEAMDQYNQGHSCLCPFGARHNLLYVKETFATLSYGDYLEVDPRNHSDVGEVRYKASEPTSIADEKDWEVRGYRWRSSVHMPRWASRLTLEVVNVKLEKLSDISMEDLELEGFEVDPESTLDPLMAFQQEWRRTNKSDLKDPYLWVIEYKVHRKNVDLISGHLSEATS